MPAAIPLFMTRRGATAAHGLDSQLDEHWSHYAACAQPGVNPDLWHHNAAPAWRRVALARHLCWRHCPVRAQCERDTPPIRSAVVAGTYYNDRGTRCGHQPVAETCRLCPAGVA